MLTQFASIKNFQIVISIFYTASGPPGCSSCLKSRGAPRSGEEIKQQKNRQLFRCWPKLRNPRLCHSRTNGRRPKGLKSTYARNLKYYFRDLLTMLVGCKTELSSLRSVGMRSTKTSRVNSDIVAKKYSPPSLHDTSSLVGEWRGFLQYLSFWLFLSVKFIVNMCY